MPVDTDHKQLQIKVGTVKRTKKEYEAYLKEDVVQRAKVEKMKAEGAEEGDIKKQLEVLNDTLTVIPDTRQRLQKYARELAEFMARCFPDEPAEDAQDLRDLVLEGRLLLKETSECLGDSLAEDTESAQADAGGADDGMPVDEF
mmetsp:Transcript_108555/g.212712  ORF Transcript_108555/g.212712 Transcript_108555/m.212712 type:complete len:144 (+) Transcript_108555:53-484(+)